MPFKKVGASSVGQQRPLTSNPYEGERRILLEPQRLLEDLLGTWQVGFVLGLMGLLMAFSWGLIGDTKWTY